MQKAPACGVLESSLFQGQPEPKDTQQFLSALHELLDRTSTRRCVDVNTYCKPVDPLPCYFMRECNMSAVVAWGGGGGGGDRGVSRGAGLQ